jgi:CIC family chloride channel protein
VVFVFEATRQPLGLLPLLAGCSTAYLISIVGMRHSIMTERLARRGAPIRTEYSMDYLSQRLVRDHAVRDVAVLLADRTLGDVREWLASGTPKAAHHGYPVVDARGDLIGVVTLRDLADPHADPSARVSRVIKRPPAVIFERSTLREAADHMVEERVGRLPVVAQDAPTRLVGMISRSDLLDAHRRGSRRATALPAVSALRPARGSAPSGVARHATKKRSGAGRIPHARTPLSRGFQSPGRVRPAGSPSPSGRGRARG